jgi:hypothetical protein
MGRAYSHDLCLRILTDESGVTSSMTWQRARSLGSCRIHEATPGGQWKIMTVLGVMRSRVFQSFFAPITARSLWPGICANGWPQPAPRHCISNQVLRGSFLYYSNLLMGEFTATNGRGKSITFALNDIITGMNFSIAIITALIGWAVLEYFRKKL